MKKNIQLKITQKINQVNLTNLRSESWDRDNPIKKLKEKYEAQLKNDKKKIESTCQSRDSSHDIMITLLKNKQNSNLNQLSVE